MSLPNATVPDTPVADVFVARQAILNRKQDVFGYELLYRSSKANGFDGTDSTVATSRLIVNSYLNIGLDRLIGGRRAFINFDRRMLVEGYGEMLPRESLVVEILEDVPPDEGVLAACRQLKVRGYQLALDDFVCADGYEGLLKLVDIVKVDFRLATPEQIRKLSTTLGNSRLRLLAEKVETQEEFRRAVQLGFDLFQGYFFCRPEVLEGRKIPGFKLNYLRILREIRKPELDFGKLEELAKREASLVHTLLRFANSASFPWSGKVESIRHALTLLGEIEVRRWITLASVAGLASDKPQQLVVDAVTRGRFCENLSKHVALGTRSSEMFLLGMYSLLDALLDRPLEEVVEQVSLASDIKNTLLGYRCSTPGLTEILALARGYQAGDWDALESMALQLGVDFPIVAEVYLESVQWADEVFRSEETA